MIASVPGAIGHALNFAFSMFWEICDRVYLETQNPANVAFYERRGFAVTGEADIPRGGPHMWLMARAPRG